MSNMLKNLETGEVFENRKQAKMVMGHANYNKAVKKGLIEYQNVKVYGSSDVVL